VAWGINNGEVVLGTLELPESNINSNTTLSFSLEFIQNPSVLEGSLSDFLSFLLELFNGSLINSTAFVNEVTGGRGFTGIDVTNDDNIDVNLFLSHCASRGKYSGITFRLTLRRYRRCRSLKELNRKKNSSNFLTSPLFEWI
jgi:hypothetical protein